MRKITACLWATIVLTASVSAQCPTGYAGSFGIGPTATFATVKQAIDSLTLRGLSGAVILELQPAYDPATETYPIRLSAISCASAVRTITIRPAAGSGTITWNNSSDATLELNGAKYFTVDGSPGGTGTGRNLIVRNTGLSAASVRLINDASFNALKNLDIQGAHNTEFGGVVFIAGTTGTTGNDSNQLDACLIHESSSLPANGIYAYGSAGKENTGNVINACEIYNFYHGNGSSHGVFLRFDNEKYRITGNSIYQTAPRTYFGSPSAVFGICTDTKFSAGHTITRNYIGGRTAGAAGQKMELYAKFSFYGIYNSNKAGAGNGTRIDSNTVTNLMLQTNQTNSSVNMISSGFYTNTGTSGAPGAHGSINDNIIGSLTSDTAIRILPMHAVTTGASILGVGIAIGPRLQDANDTMFVQRNVVSGILIDSPATGDIDFAGIFYRYTDNGITGMVNRFVISENMIGSATRPAGITARIGGALTGITLWGTSSYAIHATIRNNRILNLNSLTHVLSGSNHRVAGMMLMGDIAGTLNIINNEIRYLTQNSGDANLDAAIGIHGNQLDKGTISGNVITHIRSHYPGFNGSNRNRACGILIGNLYSGSGSLTELKILQNNIHTVHAGNGDSWANESIGIFLEMGAGKVAQVNNNFIRLGLDSTGQPMNNQQRIYGIADATGRNQILHNTVYIGGSETLMTNVYSAAYISQQTVSANRAVRNNIFVNQRANSQCVDFNSTGVTPFPETMDYNLYYAPGTNGYIGWAGTASHPYSTWKAASGKDTNSVYGNPGFISANGNAQTVNLHLTGSTPAESAGSPIGTTVTDIDGDPRASLTPVDIGADAGLFSIVTTSTVDLSFSAQSIPSSTAAGATTSVSFTENNSGNATAGSHTVIAYLSSDNILTPGINGDIIIGQQNITSLAAGANTGSQSFSVTIPCSVNAGTMYIFLADGGTVISETNEVNNTVFASVTVTKPTVNIVTPDVTVCPGTSVTITATGATSYTWSPSAGLSSSTGTPVTAIPFASITYIVTGTTNGCASTDSIRITVMPATVPAISITNTSCSGTAASFSANFTNGGSSPVVRWFVNGVASGLTGATFTLTNPLNGTQVYARLESNAICAFPAQTNSNTFTVSCVTTAVASLDIQSGYQIFPNPVSDKLYIGSKKRISRVVSIALIGQEGKIVKQILSRHVTGVQSWTIAVRDQPAGLYYLRITENGLTGYTRIVIAH